MLQLVPDTRRMVVYVSEGTDFVKALLCAERKETYLCHVVYASLRRQLCHGGRASPRRRPPRDAGLQPGATVWTFEAGTTVEALRLAPELDALVVGTNTELVLLSAKSGLPLCGQSFPAKEQELMSIAYIGGRAPLVLTSTYEASKFRCSGEDYWIRVWSLRPDMGFEMLVKMNMPSPAGSITKELLHIAADPTGAQVFLGWSMMSFVQPLQLSREAKVTVARGPLSERLYSGYLHGLEYVGGCGHWREAAYDVLYTVGEEDTREERFNAIKAFRCSPGGRLEQWLYQVDQMCAWVGWTKWDPVERLLLTGGYSLDGSGNFAVWDLRIEDEPFLVRLATWDVPAGGHRDVQTRGRFDPVSRTFYRYDNPGYLSCCSTHLNRGSDMQLSQRGEPFACGPQLARPGGMVYDPLRRSLFVHTPAGLERITWTPWGFCKRAKSPITHTGGGAWTDVDMEWKSFAVDVEHGLIALAGKTLAVWRYGDDEFKRIAGPVDGGGQGDLSCVVWVPPSGTGVLCTADLEGFLALWRVGPENSLNRVWGAQIPPFTAFLHPMEQEVPHSQVYHMYCVAGPDAHRLLVMSSSNGHLLSLWRFAPLAEDGLELEKQLRLDAYPRTGMVAVDSERGMFFVVHARLDLQIRSLRGDNCLELLPNGKHDIFLDQGEDIDHVVAWLPGIRLLVTAGINEPAPRLWTVANDGSLQEVWFPPTIYRSSVTLLGAAPCTDDQFHMVWATTLSGRLVGLSLKSLVKRSVVRSVELDRGLAATIKGWRVPVIALVSKVLSMLISFIQLLAFSFKAAVPPTLKPMATSVRHIAYVDVSVEESSMFYLSVGFVGLMAAIFFVKEWLSEWVLLNQGSLLPSIAMLALEYVVVQVGTTLAVLPLLSNLLKCLACHKKVCTPDDLNLVAGCNMTDLAGRNITGDKLYLVADEHIACWGIDHALAWLLPGLLSCIALGYMGARYTHVRQSLAAVKMKWNLLDWSGDAVVSPDRWPRSSPFDSNDLRYDSTVLITKFVIMGAETFLPLTPWDKPFKELCFAIVTVAAGSLLVLASFSFNRFRISGTMRELKLPCGLEANSLQTALDMGVFWTYLAQLNAAVRQYNGSESSVEHSPYVMLNAFMIVPMFVGGSLRRFLVCCARRRAADDSGGSAPEEGEVPLVPERRDPYASHADLSAMELAHMPPGTSFAAGMSFSAAGSQPFSGPPASGPAGQPSFEAGASFEAGLSFEAPPAPRPAGRSFSAAAGESFEAPKPSRR